MPSLPGRVAPLQADEQGALALGVHQVLQVVQLLGGGLDLRQGVLMGFVLVFESGVDLTQIDLAARLDDKLLGVVHDGEYLEQLGERVQFAPRTARRLSGEKTTGAI